MNKKNHCSLLGAAPQSARTLLLVCVLANSYFQCQKIQLQTCCHQDNHIANGNGHMDATECLMYALIVWTLDQITLHQATDLLATTDGIFDAILFMHQT